MGDGVWCEWFQAKCKNEVCGTPVDTLCPSSSAATCYGQCVDVDGEQKCLPTYRAICFGKEPGKACTDAACYGCAEPRIAACFGKNESGSCDDYQEFSTAGVNDAGRLYKYTGGECWQKG